MEKLKKDFEGKVVFNEIDVDTKKEEASKYGVFSIPTFVIEKDGKEVSRKTGFMSEKDLTNWLNEYL